ncbi:DegT/DnrJ/EryC1/StrS family aminotransferase [Tepidibacillus fermentans]|uniref:dTDP-4-amino-4,6-dideoxygalactose transaminase n=1 Tax=Tepidibacillus fermentans TaxID=1281767 RepID=A0A4R3KIX5_9BACI|nr:DegT/DnrJ/EryC1/StrS family aminotransferase [Tepidibacillus fermentans]TCS83372.1 dTDP-4-amino-4,6-dideoxygalactose transaminase [Tepidibacillus fermentans]
MIPIAKPLISDLEKKLVMEVLDSGVIASGKYVEQFEEKFADYLKVKYAVATSSGTTALHAAIEALNLPKDSEIVTTPFTFIASSNSILYSGLNPVFVDIDEKTFNIDPNKVENAVKENPKIRAILVVHLYGLPVDMDAIMEIANRYDLKVIEDCAQAHGAEINGKKVGTIGDVATFSFYPTKNMTTSEGGMVVTNNEEIYKNTKLLINHGSPERYNHTILGYNYRMTNISAAIGLGQLERLDEFNNARIKNAMALNEGLKDIDWLVTPYTPEHYKHVYHQYTVKVLIDRDKVIQALQDNQIGYGIHYPKPLHKQKVYTDRGYAGLSLPISEKMAEQVLSLPVHPALKDEDIGTIISVLNSI